MLCDKNKNALGGLALAQPPKIFRLFEIQIMQQCFVKGRCPQVRWHGLHHWAWRVCQKHALSCVQIGFTGALVQICDMSRIRFCVERDAFIAHAQQLSDAFMHVMKAPYLRLRFDVISHNACNRFHVDAMTARLICTCRAAGTQYGLANAAGDPETVHTVPTGAAIVLRGKRWPPKAKVDLVHRSPPIQGTGQTRLVLVLDPIADLDEGV